MSLRCEAQVAVPFLVLKHEADFFRIRTFGFRVNAVESASGSLFPPHKSHFFLL